ncbi:MAG TPA: trehalase family glycosidase, partial [Flavobacterium sp.]|nr:trehalase family glycosidase [Flavobacterium sp.]
KAESRKEKINRFCWHEDKAIYFDYNFIKEEPHEFEAATTFYPLWAKLCSVAQAQALVEKTLPKFKMKGGISGSTKEAVSSMGSGPQRQWDYPFGWAPHQILLWQGLLNYNFYDEAQEMAYRWLWLITKNAVDFNGTIPEKYDLETSSHKVFAEYGNVGTDFDFITEEGFGWMNASYQVGLRILDLDLKKQLALLADPDMVFGV